MLDALDRIDFETVTILGHQMRGSGGAYGFQAITDIGAALQQAAESADADVSRKWVGELSSYLDGVESISNQPVTRSQNESHPTSVFDATHLPSAAQISPTQP